MITERASTPSNQRALLAFLAAPLAWTAHLLLSYLIVSVGCAQEWQATRIVLLMVTALCAAAAVWPALRLVSGQTELRLLHWLATDERADAQPRFLMTLGAVVSAVFLLAIILGGIGPLLVPLCAASH
jgi:hypothetical protein